MDVLSLIHICNDSRIIGWQLDNEPAVQFDYNLKAELAFRDFFRAKYNNDCLLYTSHGLDFQLDGPDYRICLFTRFGSLE